MAAELVETSRLWARTVAAHRAGVGRAARRAPGQAHLQRAALVEQRGRRRSPREGDPVRGADRRRPQGPTTAASTRRLARELFIRHALVEGDWETRHHFFRDNRQLLEEVEELEHRARRRDLVVDEDDAVRVLRRAGPGRRGLRPGTSTPGGSRPAAPTPDLLTFTVDDLLSDGRRRASTPTTTPTSGPRRPPGLPPRAAVLRVRAGQRRRRRHRRHPAGRLNQVRPGRVRLAGARPARRAGHRADPLAAQDAAPRARPRARRGPGGPRPPAGRRPGRPARRRRPRAAARCAACASRRDACDLGQAARAPADHRSG